MSRSTLSSVVAGVALLSVTTTNSTATAESREPTRFRTKTVSDPMVGGMPVMQFLAPSDWQVSGGVVWRLRTAHCATNSMQVADPSRRYAFTLWPTDGYSYDQLTAQFAPIGSNYLGTELRPPVTDLQEYLRTLVLPRYADQSLRFRFVDFEALPEVAARKSKELSQPQMPVQCLAGRIRIEFDRDGETFEEDFYCTISYSVSPFNRQYVIWTCEALFSCLAPKGELDGMEPMFQTISSSFRYNPAWTAELRAVRRMFQQGIRDQNRMTAQINRRLSQTYSEISDIQHKTWEFTQRSGDRMHENFIDSVREVDTYTSSTLTYPVKLPSGYENAWHSETGDIILGTTPGFDPNPHSTVNWTRMSRR